MQEKGQRNKTVGALAIVLLLCLLGLHLSAMKGYWYIRFSQIDVPIHFLGGMCLALSALYVLKKPKYIVLVTFILGICWEMFEVYYDLTGWPFGSRGYKMDTAKDLIMDVSGAILVWLIFKFKKSKNERISDIL